MLIEHGYVRAQTGDGEEFTFLPSLARIAALGTPREIVELFALLHGPRAAETARYVLASLCEQEDPLPLVGWADDAGVHPGLMPDAEQLIIARHLMVHGICGSARPGRGDGGFSKTFDAAEYIALARVHLGLTAAEAEALSTTEFQALWAVKFPEAHGKNEVPDEDEYEAVMALVREKPRG